MRKHSHYFFPIPEGIAEADVYRLIEIVGITCPAGQHVFKKAAFAGKRGHKDMRTDWQNILDTAKRKLEMLDEDDRSAELAAKRAAKDKPTILELYGETDQARAAALAAAWDEGEKRMEQIGPNGNDGAHYWQINRGVRPALPSGTRVKVEYRNGDRETDEVHECDWSLEDSGYDIIRWRLA